MYTREQASRLKQAFWTTFGQYMAVIPSAEGLKTNWINYKTGHKHLFFRMAADKHTASIAIEISHPDLEIQALFFEQFEVFKELLQETLEEEWNWQLHAVNEYDKTISKIWQEIHQVSVFKKEDWPQLITFFKKRILALDEFWSLAKYPFDALK
ncbi:DUF4268 domain-containing protein [Olivibacter ginsenosidimutans]|uniref:DUF4268 domain-containing protein n=1 Tax=Olivibacter ginsenosidimutans TaxID=1176537 RepID=A0ABP9BP81_9SPHI